MHFQKSDEALASVHFHFSFYKITDTDTLANMFIIYKYVYHLSYAICRFIYQAYRSRVYPTKQVSSWASIAKLIIRR